MRIKVDKQTGHVHYKLMHDKLPKQGKIWAT